MSNCLTCGKPITSTEGRRPKKFCDNKGKCRNKYWRDNKVKKETITIPIKRYMELVAKKEPEVYDAPKFKDPITHDEPAQWQAPPKPKFKRTVNWYLEQAGEYLSEADGLELIADVRNEPDFTKAEKQAVILKLSNGRFNS